MLTFSQFIHDWRRKAKKEAEYMQTLLRLNRHTGGACFAIFGEEGQEFLGIVARIAAPKVDREEVALALESVFELSNVYEQN